MRLLLFGGTGQVGTELRGLALAQAVEVVAPARSMLDLNDAAAIGRIIAAEPWSAVVNAAGYTNVDGAESEEAAAFALNATAAALSCGRNRALSDSPHSHFNRLRVRRA